MKLRIAEHSGFCFGVKRAVESVESQLDQQRKIVTLGPLIHNRQMVEKLEARGVLVAEKPEDIPKGYDVVIRSHGVRRDVLESLEATGVKIIDATCPYVSKIQRIASAAQNKIVLMAGDEKHPEVEGILSYCDFGSQCFAGSDELKAFLDSDEFFLDREYILIAQTTFRQQEWEECKKLIENSYTNIDIFDTICKATMLRQKSAAELANKSDCMIVVGGYDSSNTKKLAAICLGYCKTIHVEIPEELDKFDFSEMDNIGVTAGASTPAFIIKEVQRNMSDVVNNKEEANFEEMSFEEMLNESFKIVSAREKVTAIVTSVAPNEIAVDIGTKHAGYVPLYEYTDDPNVDLTKEVKAGDEIELLVLRLNDAEGTALLSKKRLDAIAGFEKLVEAEEADQVLKGTVVDVVKGGIIVLTYGVRVFIPASQASLNRGQDLETLKGQEIEYKILETNRNRRRAVGSIRAILQAERQKLAEGFWDNVSVGQERKGIVKSLTSYGAFVDLGGVDGMIHISELSWSRIKHPSDVLTVGDEISVTIKEVDVDNKKISLGYRKDDNNPWAILASDHKVGDVVTAKIVSLTSFGAFAQVIPGVDGLIHISQISHDRIEKPSDVLSIGQEVEVAITDIDFDRKRVSLSMRALLEEEEKAEAGEDSSPEVVASVSPEATTVSAKVEEAIEAAGDAKDKAVDKAKAVAADVAEKATEIKEEAESKVKKVADKAKEKAEEIKEDVTEKVEEIAEKVKDAVEDVLD